jgi:hypothetical protein
MAQENESKTQMPALGAATIAVGTVVVVVGLVALFTLPRLSSSSAWTPVFQDVIKTGYQALAIGALGGMTKLLIDLRKAREAAAADLRDRRLAYINLIVGASHDVDNARSLIQANRSVLTWTRMINESIVPAKTRLRDITHDLENWRDAGTPVYSDSDFVDKEIKRMASYLDLLIDEHAEHKQPLSERQRAAETLTGDAREQALDGIWKALVSMKNLGNFIDGGKQYAQYRQDYVDALKAMRKSLTLRGRSHLF